MCTYVFHFHTAQIHQGSCTALGGFLFKDEPHYAIEEVLSKNTCRDLLLSASPCGQLGGPPFHCSSCSEHTATPSLPADQAVRILTVGGHTSHDLGEFSETDDICQIPRETPYGGLISGFMERRGRGMWAGSCTPKTYSVVGWTGIWCYKILILFMKSTRAKYYS